MAYAFETDEGHVGIGGEPSTTERIFGAVRDASEEWNPDRETWDDFMKRTA